MRSCSVGDIYTKAKVSYVRLRKEYETYGTRSILGEVKMSAAVYNRDRDLFKKGYTLWKKQVMKEFERIENGGTFSCGVTSSEYKGCTGEFSGEQAVFSMGESIKLKKTQYMQMQNYFDSIGWWN